MLIPRCVIPLIVALPVFPAAALAGEVRNGFEKVVLTDQYLCDGINVGDINRDGHIDIVAGPYWYAGPDFRQKHVIFPVEPRRPESGATNSMQTFVGDFNGDGWPDVLVLGRAWDTAHAPKGWEKIILHEAFWYENPRTPDGVWKKHFVTPRVMGESSALVDVDGDGKPELAGLAKTEWGMWHPNRQHPDEPWIFQAITAKRDWHLNYHGTGIGDIDGDGRPDLLLSVGWWQQSETAGGGWTEHPFAFTHSHGGAQMLVYDVNGDGRNDVITSIDAHGWGLSWFEQTREEGKIGFREHRIMGSRSEEKEFGVAFSQPHALALADLDGDGLSDIVTGKRRWAHGPAGDIEPNATPVLYWFQLVRENGQAHYIPHLIDDASGIGSQIVAVDVTGDGAPDILTASKLGTFLFINRLRDRLRP